MNAAGDVFNPDSSSGAGWARPAARGEGGEAAARRGRARRDRHPRAARASRCSRRRTSSPPGASSRSTSTRRRLRGAGRAAALLRLQGETTPSVHHFYDQLCPPCADFNFAKRTETADLARPGRPAHRRAGEDRLPGRASSCSGPGAQLIVTTRFPRDCRRRATREEPDFDDWGDRLEIFGLDLRHTPSVEAFCRHLPRPATGSTSSSTTPARPCAGRPTSTAT